MGGSTARKRLRRKVTRGKVPTLHDIAEGTNPSPLFGPMGPIYIGSALHLLNQPEGMAFRQQVSIDLPVASQEAATRTPDVCSCDPSPNDEDPVILEVAQMAPDDLVASALMQLELDGRYLRCCPACGHFFVSSHLNTRFCAPSGRQRVRAPDDRDRSAYMRFYRQLPQVKKRVTTRKNTPQARSK